MVNLVVDDVTVPRTIAAPIVTISSTRWQNVRMPPTEYVNS